MTACNATLSMSYQTGIFILCTQTLQLEKAAFGLVFEKAEIIPLFTFDNNSKKSAKFSPLSKKEKIKMMLTVR